MNFVSPNFQSKPQIFVELRLPLAIDKDFTYISDFDLEIGDLVSVEFGKKRYWAVVIKIFNNLPKELEKIELKPVLLVHNLVKLQPTHLKFINHFCDYNLASFGLVLRSFIGSLKEESHKKINLPLVQIADCSKFNLKNLRPKQSQIYQEIIENQQVRQNSHQVFVLDGATGSGKTEIYFALVAKILIEKPEAQILILMPEIALTSQIMTRFNEQFGFSCALWHSKISAKEKRAIFLGIASGSLRVLIGARSALLLPFKNLQLVVVDEEHDQSFLQEDMFSFNARDMAILLGKIANFPIILASASPSLETVFNIKNGKYLGFSMEQSEGSKNWLEIVDMRQEKSKETKKEVKIGNFLSQKLRLALEENLQNGKQSLLFLNRRGYAPLCLCKNCGEKYACANCDAYLVIHKNKNSGRAQLLCHHCGYQENLGNFGESSSSKCKFCGETNSLMAIGIAVEKLQEEIARIFPEARIALITSDDVKNFSDARDFVHKVNNREIDIIIGTQMIAKGYDFENLSLVGIIDADSLLYLGDLKSLERSFQLISQVIGRAGRRNEIGKVLIQTYQPNNFLFEKIFTPTGEIKKSEFYQFELANRARSNLPPFSQMIRFEISSTNQQIAGELAQKLCNQFPNDVRLKIFGPAPAPIFRTRNRYNFWLHLILPHKLNIQKLASSALKNLSPGREARIRTVVNP